MTASPQPAWANDSAQPAAIYLLYAVKWVTILGLRVPTWAHVAVAVVDRPKNQAMFFDLVTSRRSKVRESKVRRRNLGESDGTPLPPTAELLERAVRAMPPAYQVSVIHRHDGLDHEAALAWMTLYAKLPRHYRYRPFVALDCFHFAAESLRRSGAIVRVWQLYLRLTDGVVVLRRSRADGRKEVNRTRH